MKRVFTTVVIFVALIAGCGGDVVDVDDMTNDETFLVRERLNNRKKLDQD